MYNNSLYYLERRFTEVRFKKKLHSLRLWSILSSIFKTQIFKGIFFKKMVAKACEKACIAIITLVDTCTRKEQQCGNYRFDTHLHKLHNKFPLKRMVTTIWEINKLWASFNVQLQIFLNVILKGNRCGPSLHFEIYNENNFSLDYDCFLKTNFISM